MPRRGAFFPDDLHSFISSDGESNGESEYLDLSVPDAALDEASEYPDDLRPDRNYCEDSDRSDASGNSAAQTIPSHHSESDLMPMTKRSSALVAASRLKSIAEEESLYTKRKSPSRGIPDDMPPPKLPKQSMADTVEVIVARPAVLVPTQTKPAAKFPIGHLALVLTRRTSSIPTGILVNIRGREYCETKKQWRYVGAAEFFDDLDTSINVWEESLVKPKYQLGDVITRQLEGAVNIHGTVKSVWARGNIFEYEVEFEPVRFTDGALEL